jgi:predicted DNA-binding protein (UPF0251 family)
LCKTPGLTKNGAHKGRETLFRFRMRAMPECRFRATGAVIAYFCAALPTDQRSALTLVLIEGYSYREAAEILKVPDGTVMSRVARARRALVELHDADHAVPPCDIKRGTP